MCQKWWLGKDHNPGSGAFLRTEGNGWLHRSWRFIQAFQGVARFLSQPLSHHLQQEKPASAKLLIYWFNESYYFFGTIPNTCSSGLSITFVAHCWVSTQKYSAHQLYNPSHHFPQPPRHLLVVVSMNTSIELRSIRYYWFSWPDVLPPPPPHPLPPWD